MSTNRVFTITLPMQRPLVTSRGVFNERKVAILEVVVDGHVGYGEAAPLEDWGSESLAEAIEALQDGEPKTPAARFAWDCAYADATARAAGIPLWRYFADRFGTEPRPTIELNATLSASDTMRADAADAYARGFRTFKLKVGAGSLDDDLRRVEAFRDAFPDAKLRLDANQAWSVQQASKALSLFAPLRIAYVEEPTAGGLKDFQALRGAVSLAADESCTTPELDEIITHHAVDVLVLKPMVLGGIDRVASLVSEARAHDIDVIFTSAIDSAVARTATAQLAAALGVDSACGLATGSFFAHDTGPVEPGPTWRMHDVPGLGFVPELLNRG